MNLCFLIADLVHRIRARRGSARQHPRTLSDQAYWTWQFQSSTHYFAKFFDLEAKLPGADVIDIGCGLGGRTCFLATQGASRIVGTDINRHEISRAARLAAEQGSATVRSVVDFCHVAESDSQFESSFDVALLVDSMEHVRDPTAMLNHAYTCLRPGGTCYFSTRGWYHHQASHVCSVVPIPFATLWFSDRQILDAVRRVLDRPYYQPTMWDSDPPSLRWRSCETLCDRPGEYLNKYRIVDFRRAMRASKFSGCELDVDGFSTDRHPVLSMLNFLTRVPWIQEVYHSAIFGKLTKESAHSESRRTEISTLKVSA